MNGVGLYTQWTCTRSHYKLVLISGYFSQISTLADVQENVMRYLHVMSRPKVIDHEHDTVWTEAYVDSAVSLLQLISEVHDFL